MKVVEIKQGKGQICEQLLRSLPAWFGIEQAILDYIRDVENMTMLGVFNDDSVVGFTSINFHSQMSAEIHVMGILPEFHRKGLGRQMIEHCEEYLKTRGCKFLTVKTLSSRVPGNRPPHRPSYSAPWSKMTFINFNRSPIIDYILILSHDHEVHCRRANTARL